MAEQQHQVSPQQAVLEAEFHCRRTAIPKSIQIPLSLTTNTIIAMSTKPLVPNKKTGDYLTATEINAIVDKFGEKPDPTEIPSLAEHAANNAKVGITPQQAAAIVANTAKVGISPTQAAAIEANTLK